MNTGADPERTLGYVRTLYQWSDAMADDALATEFTVNTATRIGKETKNDLFSLSYDLYISTTVGLVNT